MPEFTDLFVIARREIHLVIHHLLKESVKLKQKNRKNNNLRIF